MNQEDSRRVAEALRNQWSGAEALMKANFGPRLADGVEFLGTRSLGTNTIKFVYLLKHEAGFYGFTVILYHPTEDWRLAGFTFGDQSRADTFALSRTESALPPGLDTVLGGSMELFAQGQWHRAMQPLVGLWYKPDEAEGSLGDMERRVRTGSALLESELGERLSRTGPGLLGIWSVGESLKCVGYELKYQRGTFPWVFMFYKAHQDWKLISLTTGSSIPEWMMPMFAVSEPQR